MKRARQPAATGFGLVIVAILLGAGCDDQSPRRVATRALEGGVRFHVVEAHEHLDSPGPPRFLLAMRTEKVYGCSNWWIDSSVEVTGHVVSVRVRGITVPEICLTSLGPATSSSFLDLEPGSYDIRLSEGDRTDRYMVSISDSSIAVTGPAGLFTQDDEPLFWRFPPDSFVLLCGTTTESKWMYDDFLHRLEVIQLEPIHFAAFGLTPYPREVHGYYYDAPVLYFRYGSHEDFQRVADILIQYSQHVIGYNLGIGIELRNWQNEWYGSWMYTPSTP